MKFSIRDLFWLTTLAAVGTGWAVDHYLPHPIRYTKEFGAADPWLEGKTINDAFTVPGGSIVVRFTDGTCCRINDVGLAGPEVEIENDVGKSLIHSHRTYP